MNCLTKKIDIACINEKTVIYSSVEDRFMKKTIEWCIGYLTERRFDAIALSAWNENKSNSSLWLFELEGNCPVSKSMGLDDKLLEKSRGDAYMLNIFEYKGKTVVSIIGKGIKGVRSGITRLIAVSSLYCDRIVAEVRSEVKSPFFRVRRLAVAPTGRIAGKGPWSDTLWTNWSDDRIRKYVEQLWMFGFNSLEFCELRGYRCESSGSQSPFNDIELIEKIAPKLRVFASAAREYGLEVCQFIWGQSLFEEGQNFCWNNPAERALMRGEYARLAKTYGDLVDHIVVHVGDPGGCDRNGCDAYRVPQEIAMAIFNEYVKVNPVCTATLSTWANFGFWRDCSGAQFLDESFSKKEIAIALHRWYDRDKARAVKAAGREVDIWGWYLSDYEMELNCHLLMKRLDKYYSALPEEVSESIRAVSTEICFSGLPNLINAYISAQKMWGTGQSYR